MSEADQLRSALARILSHCDSLIQMKHDAPNSSLEAVAHIASKALAGEPVMEAYVAKMTRPRRLLLNEEFSKLTHPSASAPTPRADRVRPAYLEPELLERAKANGEHRLLERIYRAPDGWKLVPLEATKEMLRAVYPYHYAKRPGLIAAQEYKQMVEAAPSFLDLASVDCD